MLTVKEIMAVTPRQPKQTFKERVRKVQIVKVKRRLKDPDMDMLYYHFNTTTDSDVYDTEILLTPSRFIKSNRALLNRYAFLSCSCPRFIYHSEHALWLKGSAARRFTEGVEPGEGSTGMKVNPRLIPYVCKHVVTGFEAIPGLKVRKTEIPMKVLMWYEKGQKKRRPRRK